MRFGSLKTSSNVSQKKRYFLKKKNNIKLNFGSSCLFFWNFLKFECVYLKIIKKLFKTYLKKKKKTYLSRKLWINLKQNYPISKKSKNSRMGKGKGLFLRWIIIIKPMSIIFEFLGFNFFFYNIIKKKIKSIVRRDVFLYHHTITYNLWVKSNLKKSLTFCKKKFNF